MFLENFNYSKGFVHEISQNGQIKGYLCGGIHCLNDELEHKSSLLLQRLLAQVNCVAIEVLGNEEDVEANCKFLHPIRLEYYKKIPKVDRARIKNFTETYIQRFAYEIPKKELEKELEDTIERLNKNIKEINDLEIDYKSNACKKTSLKLEDLKNRNIFLQRYICRIKEKIEKLAENEISCINKRLINKFPDKYDRLFTKLDAFMQSMHINKGFITSTESQLKFWTDLETKSLIALESSTTHAKGSSFVGNEFISDLLKCQSEQDCEAYFEKTKHDIVSTGNAWAKGNGNFFNKMLLLDYCTSPENRQREDEQANTIFETIQLGKTILAVPGTMHVPSVARRLEQKGLTVRALTKDEVKALDPH